MRNPIAPIISDRVPGVIKSSYPEFHKLLKDYFAWLETNGNYLDALTSHLYRQEANKESEYIDLMLKELGWEYSSDLAVSKLFLVNTLREFYLSRGSENSIKFLFRAVFGEKAYVDYPKRRLFMLSAANYSKESVVYVTALSFGSPEFQQITTNTESLSLTISSTQNNWSTSIDSFTPITIDGTLYLELVINDINKKFVPSEIVILSNGSIEIAEQILNSPKLTVKSRGKGYAVGDQINLSGARINGDYRVQTVYKGKVDRITIANGGNNYRVGDRILAKGDETGHSFYAIVTEVAENSPTDDRGSISSIEIISGGYDYSSIPIPEIKSNEGTGAIIIFESETIGGVKTIEILNQYYGVSANTSINVNTTNGTGAVFGVDTSSCITNHRRRYKNQKGFMGSNCILQDSDYFQLFSYEIRSGVSRSRYDDLVDTYAHPTGIQRYAVYDTETILGVGIFDSVASIIKVKKVELDSPDVFEYVLPGNTFESIMVSEYEEDGTRVLDINTLEQIKFVEGFEYDIERYFEITPYNDKVRIYEAPSAVITQEPI